MTAWGAGSSWAVYQSFPRISQFSTLAIAAIISPLLATQFWTNSLTAATTSFKVRLVVSSMVCPNCTPSSLSWSTGWTQPSSHCCSYAHYPKPMIVVFLALLRSLQLRFLLAREDCVNLSEVFSVDVDGQRICNLQIRNLQIHNILIRNLQIGNYKVARLKLTNL